MGGNVAPMAARIPGFAPPSRPPLPWAPGPTDRVRSRRRTSSPARRERPRRLRRSWLWGGLAVGVGVLLGAVALRHGQLARLSSIYRQRGTESFASGEFRLAQRWLETSLAFGPDDPETQAALAGALARTARQPGPAGPSRRRSRAVQLYTLALGARPGATEWWLERGELELIENPAAALSTAEALLANHSTDLPALELRARALAAARQRQDTEQTRVALHEGLDDLMAAHPTSGLGVALRANLVLEAGEQLAIDLDCEPDDLVAEVWRALARWIAEDSQSGEARLARYAFRRQLARVGQRASDAAAEGQDLTSAAALLGKGELDHDLERALELSPDRADVQLAAAEHWVPEAFRRGWFATCEPCPVARRLERCQTHLLAAIAAQPHDDRAYLVLAELARLAGDQAALEVIFRQAAQGCQPPTPRLLLRRAEWQAETRQWAEVRRSLTAAQELSRAPSIRQWLAADPTAAEEFALVPAICRCRMLAEPEGTPWGSWSTGLDDLETLASRLQHPDLAALGWSELERQATRMGDDLRARRARDRASRPTAD